MPHRNVWEARIVVPLLLAVTVLLSGRFFGTAKEPPSPEAKGWPVRWSKPTTFQFQDYPLFDALSNRANAEGFALFLDRRVDPSLLVNSTAENIPLITALGEMLEPLGLDYGLLGPLLYVGPAGAAGELLLAQALHRQRENGGTDPHLSRLNDEIRLHERPFGEPRAMLDGVAKKVGFQWEGLEKMPFDCWRAVDLPPMPAREVISLLLIGFGVDYGPVESRPILKPISFRRNDPVTRLFAPAQIDPIPAESFPDCSRTPTAGMVRVEGPFESMARLEQRVAQSEIAARLAEAKRTFPNHPKRPDASALSATGSDANRGEKRVNGEVRQVRIADLFDYLGKNLGLKCELDRSVASHGITLESRITCEFVDADRKKAVTTVANALGLVGRLNADRALFSAPKK